MVCAVVPDPLGISAASLLTVTVSATAPVSSAKFAVECGGVYLEFLQDGLLETRGLNDDLIRHRFKGLKEKVPELEVVTVKDLLVPRLVTVTVALGTDAPFWSTTVPLIPPLFVCPIARAEQNRATISIEMNLITILLH